MFYLSCLNPDFCVTSSLFLKKSTMKSFFTQTQLSTAFPDNDPAIVQLPLLFEHQPPAYLPAILLHLLHTHLRHCTSQGPGRKQMVHA